MQHSLAECSPKKLPVAQTILEAAAQYWPCCNRAHQRSTHPDLVKQTRIVPMPRQLQHLPELQQRKIKKPLSLNGVCQGRDKPCWEGPLEDPPPMYCKALKSLDR